MSHNHHAEQIPEAVLKEIQHLDEINNKLNDQIEDLKAKSTQVASLFFIFQAVILTSIFSGSSSLSCHHWWIPFALSLLAATLNVFSFYTSIKYHLVCLEKLDQNLENCQLMRVHKLTRDQLILVKPGMEILCQGEASGSSNGHEHRNGSVTTIVRSRPDTDATWRRRGLAYSGLALLLAFSAVILYACRVILCSHKDLKCVRTC